MENTDIRLLVLASGLKYKDIAQAIGIRGESLSRWMKKPLTEEQRHRVQYAIDCLKERRGQDG